MEYPPIVALAKDFADPVNSASFSAKVLRFRNQFWATRTGLGSLDSAQWLSHFGDFVALPGNLESPLAFRYHGHQFGTYNPQLGDGRGFLFAQVRDQQGRLLDLGTKGSGQTPWSRNGDGRLTLKGGVREILAATYLEALGVNTSKAFSLIETGEQLHRNDEPSPARGSVLVRLSHSHIRFGTFQRAAYMKDTEGMTALANYCVEWFYSQIDGLHIRETATALLQCISEATARMIGQWMACGFVHGVMNTDNFNITGETFDFGPWRFLPKSDPNFVAAYFDENGLYRFGRQPVQGLWALQQLASSLLLLNDDVDALAAALGTYEATYQNSFSDHTHRLLGLTPLNDRSANLSFLQDLFGWMTMSEAIWPQVFFDWFCGKASTDRAAQSPQAALYSNDQFAPIRSALFARRPDRPERLRHPYFAKPSPVSLLVDDVEALWSPIAASDDWAAFEAKMAHLEAARTAMAL